MINEQSQYNVFEKLWKNAIIGLALVDGDGTFIRANPRFCGLVGYSEYELQQRRWQDITHPDDLKADSEMSDRVILDNNGVDEYTMSKRYLTKTGKVVWVLLHATKIKKEDGTFQYLLSQISEVLEIAPPLLPLPKNQIKSSLWENIKEHYTIILAILGALAILISNILKG